MLILGRVSGCSIAKKSATKSAVYWRLGSLNFQKYVFVELRLWFLFWTIVCMTAGWKKSTLLIAFGIWQRGIIRNYPKYRFFLSKPFLFRTFFGIFCHFPLSALNSVALRLEKAQCSCGFHFFLVAGLFFFLSLLVCSIDCSVVCLCCCIRQTSMKPAFATPVDCILCWCLYSKSILANSWLKMISKEPDFFLFLSNNEIIFLQIKSKLVAFDLVLERTFLIRLVKTQDLLAL